MGMYVYQISEPLSLMAPLSVTCGDSSPDAKTQFLQAQAP